MAQDIFFQGVVAPLRLGNADAVLQLLPAIATGWPYRVTAADPALRPFFSITAQPGTDRFRCEGHLEPAPARSFDAVNAACDAMAALAQALPLDDRRLLCLHAAGVVLSGQLWVFPNIRRAGKSTLSVALAHAGHAVYSDDVVPLILPQDGPARGLALGIAPRLRLPLPDAAGQGFRDWVAGVPGPRNRQYQYLALTGQPVHGDSLPVAGFVILDRQDSPVAARLDPVPPDVAMDALLHQNFTRDRHSGEVLQAIADLLALRPVCRLQYSDLTDAVDCLAAGLPTSPVATDLPGPMRLFRPAQVDTAAPPLRPGAPIRQRPGSVARAIGDAMYLADPEGRAIHRMDPLAAAIWDVLDAPATATDLLDLLAESFPATDPARIAADLDSLLRMLAAWGLVES